MLETSIIGCVLGTAAGDALGLPYEGISRQRAPRLLGPPNRYRFLFCRGMISDDTEHTCVVAQALIGSHHCPKAFATDLAARFKWWVASLPAGLGRATLWSCIRLWIGYSPEKSGIWSAGNGPAMRSAIIGVACSAAFDLSEMVRASTRITHTDPKAEYGAIAVAVAARLSSQVEPVGSADYLEQLRAVLNSDYAAEELLDLLRRVAESVSAGQKTQEFALQNGHTRGVSGYTYHTVPIAIHAWLSNPRDFRSAVLSVIECGGDTDTTAAIVGGIVGAAVGEAGIPDEWIDNILEWPRSVAWMRELSVQLAESLENAELGKPMEVSFAAAVVRNQLFLLVVLFHGLRRLLPPY